MNFNLNDIVIPSAVQLVVDDVGWFWGGNEHESGGPYRTGIPRHHVQEDYTVIGELGKRINQRINVMFVIGEWDRRGILRDVPYSNKYGRNWRGSEWFDPAEAEKIRNYINGCECIELGYHGLLHDLWTDDGKKAAGREFFQPCGDDAPQLAAPEIIRKHFDAFLSIYNDWGFRGELRTFAAPGGPGEYWKSDVLSGVLSEYGVQYWHNNTIRECSVRSGIILNPKSIQICPWDVYDLDPAELPAYAAESVGILGSHWPNLLRYHPKKNLERLDAWKDFFDRLSETFGAIISRDIEFAHLQQLHRAFASLALEGKLLRIDLSRADALSPKPLAPFYVSMKNSLKPIGCTGGSCSLYESKPGFNTYKILRSGESSVCLELR